MMKKKKDVEIETKDEEEEDVLVVGVALQRRSCCKERCGLGSNSTFNW